MKKQNIKVVQMKLFVLARVGNLEKRKKALILKLKMA